MIRNKSYFYKLYLKNVQSVEIYMQKIEILANLNLNSNVLYVVIRKMQILMQVKILLLLV